MRNNTSIFLYLAWILSLVATQGHARDIASASTSVAGVSRFFSPLRSTVHEDPEKVALGRDLFHEPRLSSDGTIACASCHDTATNGADSISRSVGVSGRPGAVNSPTIFNAVPNFSYFWDGRAKTPHDQIDGPIHHPDEMNSSWPIIVARLSRNSVYLLKFAKIYSGEVSERTIKDAIVSYERSLTTPGSRFDRYLEGDIAALTHNEREGLELFVSYGCVACHQGHRVGGNMFQRLGVYHDYFMDRGDIETADYGRFNVTGNDDDRFYFKVPSLRNVALTGPYMHDGHVDEIEDAVRIMGYYQLGAQLSEDEIHKIVSFLNTLTGDIPVSSK